jgi:two-component system, OmpR family, phosphate regulon response regulator PhoB
MQMDLFRDTPGSLQTVETAVEIEVWEGYLIRNNTNLRKTLCTYSLDNGPLDESTEGHLVFRFTSFDWKKNILDLLGKNNIHFRITGKTPLDTLSQLLKKKIYIAEDDPDISAALASMLERAGYQVRVSINGAPILAGNYSWVDLFILDKQMPDADGLDICRQLRAQAATRDTPVIVISAHPRSGTEALHAGANDYIEKPFEMHYLLNVVAKFLKRANRDA